MARPSRLVITSMALAIGLALFGTGTASAGTSRPDANDHARIGADNVAGAGAAFATAAPRASTAQHAAKAFPSAKSTVIASVGFIDDTQVGWFWSAARGDSVEQSFTGPAQITRACFKLTIPQ